MKVVNSKQLSDEWLALQHHKHDNPDLYRLKSTGITGLDNILGGGVEPGQFILIGGAQKSGKTTLLSCITESLALQGLKILFLSGEMTTIQNANLFFSRMARIDRTRIRAVNLDKEDWVNLENTAQRFAKYAIWWNHGFSSISDIEAIMSAVEKENEMLFDAIVVDYIQLMEAPEAKGKGNRVQELEYISRNLKRKSIKENKPILVLAATQINRTSIRGNLLDANAFLGSGSLERDMDAGMIIHPYMNPLDHTESKSRKTITVVGSRETGIGSIDVFYHGATATIKDADRDPSEINMNSRPF